MPGRPGSNCRCSNRRRYRAHQESGRSLLASLQSYGVSSVSAIRSTPAVAAMDNARLAPASPAGIDRVKSAKSNRRQVRQVANPPAIPGAPERAGHLDHQGDARPRHHRRAARLCALRRPDVATLTDGRCSGGFTLEATVAARHANTPELSVW